MPKFLTDILLGTVIKGLWESSSKVVAKTIAEVIGMFFTQKMVAKVMFYFADILVRRTKNSIDDKLVADWKEEVRKNGIDIT